jgi:flagellar hook-length control protein FliK
LLIRLDPAELGRINIRMSVNEQGHLRAVVAADAPAVLDAIRGDVSELNRALEQAGVRTDSQSFRFDRGGGGDQSGQWQQRYQKQNAGIDQGQTSSFAGNDDQPAYRSMATTGRVNMMA